MHGMGWSRVGMVALVGNVSGRGHGSVLELRRHAIVCLRVGHVVGVDGAHVLLVLRVLLVVIVRGIVRLPAPRGGASHLAGHVAGQGGGGGGQCALPSRQMAVTHPAGLGYRDVADVGQKCGLCIYSTAVGAQRWAMGWAAARP